MQVLPRAALLLVAAVLLVCEGMSHSDASLDTRAPIAQRVEALLNKMTVAEMIAQLRDLDSNQNDIIYRGTALFVLRGSDFLPGQRKHACLLITL